MFRLLRFAQQKSQDQRLENGKTFRQERLRSSRKLMNGSKRQFNVNEITSQYFRLKIKPKSSVIFVGYRRGRFIQCGKKRFQVKVQVERKLCLMILTKEACAWILPTRSTGNSYSRKDPQRGKRNPWFSTNKSKYPFA